MTQKRLKTMLSLGIAALVLLIGTSAYASASHISNMPGATSEQGGSEFSTARAKSVPAWLIAKYNAHIRMINHHNANPPNPQNPSAVRAYNLRAQRLNAELSGIIAQIKQYSK